MHNVQSYIRTVALPLYLGCPVYATNEIQHNHMQDRRLKHVKLTPNNRATLSFRSLQKQAYRPFLVHVRVLLSDRKNVLTLCRTILEL